MICMNSRRTRPDGVLSLQQAKRTAMPRNASTISRATPLLLAIMVVGLVFVPDLWAGGTGTTMPWNTPMQTLLNNMTGPTARILVGIATAFSGYKWMFQSHEQGANNLARVTVGGAIALTAQTIISYASFGGALI
jgi:type IV secretory pathway VirB2 component (pilin)